MGCCMRTRSGARGNVILGDRWSLAQSGTRGTSGTFGTIETSGSQQLESQLAAEFMGRESARSDFGDEQRAGQWFLRAL
jgi:hypothetical protein